MENDTILQNRSDDRWRFTIEPPMRQILEMLAAKEGTTRNSIAERLMAGGIASYLGGTLWGDKNEKGIEQLQRDMDGLKEAFNSLHKQPQLDAVALLSEVSDQTIRIEQLADKTLYVAAIALGFVRRVWQDSPDASPEFGQELVERFEKQFYQPERMIALAAAKRRAKGN